MGIVAGDLLFRWTPRPPRRNHDEWGDGPTKKATCPKRCNNVHNPECDGYLRVTDRWEHGDSEYLRYVCTECYAITRETADKHLSKPVVYIQK